MEENKTIACLIEKYWQLRSILSWRESLWYFKLKHIWLNRVVARFKELPDHYTAHKHSIRHYDELINSEICGCFFCEKIYSPVEITYWFEEEGTAVCPYCCIDSVIGSGSGYSITPDLLARMRSYWFGDVPKYSSPITYIEIEE